MAHVPSANTQGERQGYDPDCNQPPGADANVSVHCWGRFDVVHLIEPSGSGAPDPFWPPGGRKYWNHTDI